MEKSGKPEHYSSSGNEDRKPAGPVYPYHTLSCCSSDDNYMYALEYLPASASLNPQGPSNMGLEEYWAPTLPNQPGSSSSPPFQAPDELVYPTHITETPDRSARKREIDRKYRERNKNKEQEMKSDLGRLDGENEQLMHENDSLRQKHVSMDHSVQSQARDIQQLRDQIEFWNFEHAKQMALVQTLSDQFLASVNVQAENQRLREENLRLRQSFDRDETVLKLAEDTANLKLEKTLLTIKKDALVGKMVHRRHINPNYNHTGSGSSNLEN